VRAVNKSFENGRVGAHRMNTQVFASTKLITAAKARAMIRALDQTADAWIGDTT